MFNAPPMIDRKLYQSKGQKLAGFVGIFFLLCIVLSTGVIALAMVGYVVRGNLENGTIPSLLISSAICAASIFGLVKLIPFFRRPVDFAPRFGVPPMAWGQPFDVRLQRKGTGAGFSGEGVVQFFPDHMIIDAYRETHAFIQLAIALAVTVVPLLTTGVGLGFIPALLLAKYIGRKKVVQGIAYQSIRSITLDGNSLTINCPDLSPAKSRFYVASVDGPRLHGEVQPRFAAMLASQAMQQGIQAKG